MKEIALTALLAALEEPGHLLVFVDDGGTSSQPIPHLVRDFAVYAGVLIPSEAYPDLQRTADGLLAEVGEQVVEFRATEVVNPKRRSPFYGLSIATRLRCLQRWGDLLIRFASHVPYGYIGVDQYREMRDRLPPDAPEDHRAALKHAFYTRMLK